MAEPTPDEAVTEIHVDDWIVAHVLGQPDAGGWERVLKQLDPHITTDTQIVIDLRRADADPADAVTACTTLARTASDRRCHLLIVTSDEQVRHHLRGAGVGAVYESLDAALHVTAPALRRAEVPARPEPLMPAIGDALLVAAEDTLPDDKATGPQETTE